MIKRIKISSLVAKMMSELEKNRDPLFFTDCNCQKTIPDQPPKCAGLLVIFTLI